MYETGQEVWQDTEVENRKGISRDFGPGAEIAVAEYLKDKPLGIEKLMQVTIQLLQAKPLDTPLEQARKAAATYKGRRLMNAIAFEIPLQSTDLASLGYWVGQVEGRCRVSR